VLALAANEHRTPLHAAIATGNEKIVSLLLENGAEFTSDSDGWSALHIAVLIGNEEMVNFLLVRGVDRLAIDADGQTPSNWAAFTAEELEGALYKLRYKQKNSFTITGLRIAASQGHDVRVRQLLKNGADIDARDDGGWYVTNLFVSHEANFGHSQVSTNVGCS